MTKKFRVVTSALISASLAAVLGFAPTAASALETGAIDVLPTDKILYCQEGTALHLAGPCRLSEWTSEARLEIDRHVVARDPDGAMDGPYAFTWIAPAPGQYVVEVTYALASGGRAIARHFALRVTDTPPLDWETGPRDEDNDFPVALRRAPLKEFRVAQSYVLIDGQPLPVDPLDFTATVPGGSIGDGVHSAAIEAFDHSGDRYISEPVTFGVPPRIVMTSPGSLVVRETGATVPLRAKVSPLWRPVNITYYVDQKPVASADHAPFVAHADLRAYDSGNYALSAVAVDEDGNVASTPPVQVSIINIPRERAEEARERSVSNAPASPVAPLLVPAPAVATGSDPGGSSTVHGVGAGLTSDGAELIGLPVTVHAEVTPGNDRTTIPGFADDAAQAAAQSAMAWVRKQSGAGWEMTLSVENDTAQQGEPDGVTDALALYAALTGKTIDGSVMAIGNLTETGELIPVGNVISKADYALSRARVETLIVPNSPATTEELNVLAKMKPLLFQGKHVIYAQTMADVLKDALTAAPRAARVTPHVLAPAARPASALAPLPPLQATPTQPTPSRAAAAPTSGPDDDPLNAQLDQWQKLYEQNAGSLKSLATNLLHMMGGTN